MKQTLSWPAFCITAFVLGGCAQVASRPATLPTPLVTAARSDIDYLAFTQRFAAMSAEEQKKEFATASLSLNRNKGSLANRMRTAIMLALPSSRVRDNNRALALLDDVLHDEQANAETRSLASLLRDYANDRVKLEDNAGKLAQKAADEQKRADTMQQKAEALQQKLDELKNIEKALTDRDQLKPK